MTHLGELTVKQTSRHLALTMRPVPLEADESVTGVRSGEVDRHMVSRGHGAGCLVEDLGWHQSCSIHLCGAGIPRDFLEGHAITVSGKQGELVTVDLHTDAGEDGQQLISTSSDEHLGDGFGEDRRVHRSSGGRHLR